MKINHIETEIGKILEVELSEGEDSIIVSDTHLGLKYKGRELSKSSELSDFFENVLQDARVKLVVLLGDIFDFWSASIKDIIRSAYDPVKILAGSDKTIIYVAGNHDRIVANVNLESRRGRGDVYAVPDFFILKNRGKKFLLLHGHQLDTLFTRVKGLWKLQSYIYILSESLFSLPGPSEWMLAAISTLILALFLLTINVTSFREEVLLILAAFFLLSPLIILSWRKVQDKIWYGLVQRTSSKFLKSRLRGKSLKNLSVRKPLVSLIKVLESVPEIGRIDGVIMGHTHVPEILVENGRVYANTGAWVENGYDNICTFVRVSTNSITMGKWENNAEKTIHVVQLHQLA